MTDAWLWHGGAIEAARQRFGGCERLWIDLSTGINPAPWPGAATMAIDWRRLPEASALALLETAAAAHFGADPRHVCAVPGTEVGMRLVGRIIGGPARYVAPAYRTHGEMIAGSRPIAWTDAMETDGTLILANPNNPDGRCLDRATLQALLARRGSSGWLLIDEAFADADPAQSLADAVTEEARLLIFRSFGKFFGLAGLRLGFVIAPSQITAPLRRLLGAWPLSAAALAIGTPAYRDRAWIAQTRQELKANAATLDACLQRHGYQPRGACPLFRLLETDDAQALFERLARRAILTRPFADQPRWLRIGLPADPAALDRLDAALGHG